MSDWNNNFYLKWGITLILFLFGLFCFLKDRGFCEEYSHYFFYNIPVEEEFMFQHYECRSNWQSKPGRQHSTPQSQRYEWKEAYDNHHYNAVRTYTDAYNRIWFLPDINMRQLGRDAWIASCATAGGSNITGRLVIAFTAMLSQYGLHCLDEWDYIQDKLYWSNYHFEQCAYYAGLLHG